MEVDKKDMVVQIISGFRGSGKTTFLNQCIEQIKGKTAVIQNDFGAQVVDRENVEGSLIYEEIGEGCICCGMALEFEEKMRRIAMEDCLDRIFIEASGFGKLSDVVKVCTQLKEKEHLEMVIGPNVTVVDIGMVEAYASGLGEFYVDQIEHADVILVNNIDSDDAVNAYLRVKNLSDTDFINSHYVLFCTKNGVIKKTLLEQYSRPRQNGVNAITIREDDRVIEVRMTNGDNEIIIANRNGRAIRFHESAVRVMGRTATGVRGMTLDEDGQDEVVGMICIKDPEAETIMVVSEQGYGKRSDIEDYRKTNRGGKGVKTMNITDKTGKLVTIKSVTDDNDLMIINKSGITIRLKVADVRIMGRATQGVRLINLEKRNDEIGSVCKVTSESMEDEIPVDDENSPIPTINEVEGEEEDYNSDNKVNNEDEE